MKIKVKICGIRTKDAAYSAVTAGADFIGLNFVPDSRRLVDIPIALEIVKFAKENILTVGVFKNAPVFVVNTIADTLDLDFVQLHGEESSEYIRKMHKPVIKKITTNTHLEHFLNNSADYFILDRDFQGKGSMVNFKSAERISKCGTLFLAGGLTPENVSQAVLKVNPYAVDVAGGIETDGIQDPHKIIKFIHNAKGVIL